MFPPPRPIAEHALLELLGSGGMGRVWLAQKDGALVALKTMREDQANEPRIRSLFAKEMRLAASIAHPNVARVLACGEDNDVPYLAMEWVDGCSLRAVSKGRRGKAIVPLGVALRIIADACAGLHAAHDLTTADGSPLGLVHRDVSPHNIIVARSGVTKLIDFGIAKVREAVTGDTTSSGGIKGKVRYMAPEQARARPIDRRADVFAIGAVLFELVTGAPPFEGPNDLAILNELLTPEPTLIPAHVPAPIAAVLARALAKKVQDRFATAAEMGAAIDLAASELGIAATLADVAELVALHAPEQRSVRPLASTDETRTLVQAVDAVDAVKAQKSSTRRGPRRWLAAAAGAAVALALAIGMFSTHHAGAPVASAPAETPAEPRHVDERSSAQIARPALADERATPTLPEAVADEPAAKPKTVRAASRRVTSRATVAAAPAAPDDLTTSLRDRR